jgi:hypothetical protein
MRRSFIAGLAFAVLFTGHAVAAEHGHGQHGDKPGLHLNAGKRWPTDGALRQGMEDIRTIMAEAPARPDYGRMGVAIEAKTDAIVLNCKLGPEADAQLHLILAGLIDGAQAMKGSKHPKDGASLVHGALKDYGQFFDHPGWRPVAR